MELRFVFSFRNLSRKAFFWVFSNNTEKKNNYLFIFINMGFNIQFLKEFFFKETKLIF